ncbi:hypothetical protein EIP86_004017 [Pleurotus ostreatoroseus]|nr:hypothetical protein EIP86_004017 [Pleurotus ostreatoroseus]
MSTRSMYLQAQSEAPSRVSPDGAEADDEGVSDSSHSTSSWSELASPYHSSFEDDDDDEEYNEAEFTGILALASQSRELYATTHAIQDLEDSIAYLRDAFTVAPPENLARAELLHMLAYELYLLSQARGVPSSGIVTESLNDSVRLHRQALKLLPPPHPSRALYFTRLAIALRARFLRANTSRDLDECIALHRRALGLRPAGHADRAQSLLNLANAYWTRYESAGNVVDLDDAIRYDRQTLELRPPGHSGRAGALRSLATDLTARYRRTQQLSDLNGAIALQWEALQLHSGRREVVIDEDVRGSTAHQLVAHLVLRYSIDLEREDVERAAKVIRELCSQANGRVQDFAAQIASEVRLDLGNLQDGTEQPQSAAASRRTLSGNLPSHAAFAINLAHALTEPHGRTSRMPSVEEAISRGTRPRTHGRQHGLKKVGSPCKEPDTPTS